MNNAQFWIVVRFGDDAGNGDVVDAKGVCTRVTEVREGSRGVIAISAAGRMMGMGGVGMSVAMAVVVAGLLVL